MRIRDRPFHPERLFEETGRLQEFLRGGTSIFRALIRAASVTRQDVVAHGGTEAGHCRMCAGPLGTVLTRCTRCKALDHAICRDLFGGCGSPSCTDRWGGFITIIE